MMVCNRGDCCGLIGTTKYAKTVVYKTHDVVDRLKSILPFEKGDWKSQYKPMYPLEYVQ